jgi:ubiquinone/menaquinone biosynthesis C-methylase UbiE
MPDKAGFFPEFYWSKEKAEEYDSKRSVAKIQQAMTREAINLIQIKKGSLVCDVGCGTGFSMEELNKEFEVVGLDISMHMLRIAKRNGNIVVCGDFSRMPFKDKSFESVVSISTLQWARDYIRVAYELKRITKSKSVVQFYPSTEKEFEVAVDAFKDAGFGGFVVTVGESKKKKKYIVLQPRN